MSLVVYNTLKREKETFEPLKKGHVGIYVCGPTVYGDSHLGHAKSYISFDVIVRWFRQLGYKVRYVQNITDVGHLTDDADEGEDKITKQARLEKTEPMEVVETYTWSYFDDMDLLNNLRPDITPRASGHMIEQIEVIKGLLEKGYAYEHEGTIYYDVHQFKEYGKLSGKKLEDLEAGVRVSVAEGKKHPADFALWKKADPEHLMRWVSPWGEGYPGWHLECSTMGNKYLGETIDIHGGGLENIFPHHECEIAQAEAMNDKPFVRYWLHNNMVTVDGVKMGKSLNNYVTLKDAFKKYAPMTLRLFILQSHYRSPLDFSDEALEASKKGWHRIAKAWSAVTEKEKSGDFGSAKMDIVPFTNDFTAAMNDDFNTPRAIAVVFDLIKELNRVTGEIGQLDEKSVKALSGFFSSFVGDGLGLVPDQSDERSESALGGVLDYLIELRQDLRQNKDFKRADQIRDKLQELGIQLKDGADGSRWEFSD